MPRSPSRDLSDRYIGNRGYFHRWDPIRKYKYILAGVAIVFIAAWVAADVIRPSKAVYAHTHGALAGVHKPWEENCAACHVGYTPGDLGVLSLFNARERWHNLTCEKCHAGPVHHAAVRQAQECADCHHDHQGVASSLTRIDDAHCTKCHANLADHQTSTNRGYHGKITSFVSDHPEFKALIDHPPGTPVTDRKLKFSHAQHLTPGQAYTQGGKEAITIARLRELSGAENAERYRKPGQSDDKPVTLDCASCHRLDSGTQTPDFDKLKAALDSQGQPERSILPPRAEGAYFLPVNFEAHCQACHPLKAPAHVSSDKKKTIESFDVPHRRKPQEVYEFLIGGYVRGFANEKSPPAATPALPGSDFTTPAEGARKIEAEAKLLSDKALKDILSPDVGCAKCHDVSGVGGEMKAMKIAPVPDRTVWFTHAKFNHASHRGTACASCHPGTDAAYAPEGTKVVDKEPVLIVGVESCKACHSAAGTRVDLPGGERILGGGVRHSCTDCHSYHNGDHSLEGRGAKARNATQPLDLSEFLKGRR
jgi:hypothetical protein